MAQNKDSSLTQASEKLRQAMMALAVIIDCNRRGQGFPTLIPQTNENLPSQDRS